MKQIDESTILDIMRILNDENAHELMKIHGVSHSQLSVWRAKYSAKKKSDGVDRHGYKKAVDGKTYYSSLVLSKDESRERLSGMPSKLSLTDSSGKTLIFSIENK